MALQSGKINIADIKHYMSEAKFVDFKGIKSNTPLRLSLNSKIRFIRLSLQVDVSFHLDSIEIFNAAGKDISANKKTIISSCYNDDEKYDGRGVLRGTKNGGCGFHTKKENSPWLVIDLGSAVNVSEVIVYNREGEHYTRALSLMVETSTDMKQWEKVFDNWLFLKEYKNGMMSTEEKALLFAAVLEPSYSQSHLKSLKNQGKDKEAIVFLDLVNELVRPKNLALGPHGFMETFELSSADRKQTIYSELAQLLKWLNEEFKVKAFISSGTLLGITRDGKLIPHDDDVDICYVSNERTEDAILAEREKIISFLREKGCWLASSGLAHYWCKTPKGVLLDIFTGFTEGENCSMNPLRRNRVKQADVLPVSTVQISGVDLYIPNNPEALLKVNYGESWSIPDPLWEFDWSTARAEYNFLYPS